MATPTLTLINNGGLTDGVLSNADTNTGWTDLTTPDPDIKVQGTNSASGIGRANNEDEYYDSTTAPVTAAGKVWRWWTQNVNVPYMGTLAGADPYEILFYDGTTTTRRAYLGSDTYEGGWVYVFQDMDLVTTGNGWTNNITLANVRRWGHTTGHTVNAKNAINVWGDVMRYMDGYYITGGSSGDKVLLSNVFAVDMSNTYAYGIVQRSRGVYFGTGTIQIGNGATTTYFDMTGEVLQFVDTVGYLQISAGLYTISATGSGCDCVITGSVIRGPSSDDSTRVYFDFSDTNHVLTFTNNLIVNGGTVEFASGQTATGNTFDDCLQITHGGANMNNCTVQGYEGSSDTAAVLYDVAVDPDGEMDGMTFIKGTASTHAIEFGSNTPGSITLRSQTYTGYNASNGNADSTFYNNTGGALTINIVGGSGNVTYKNGSGASTTIVQDPVTLTVHVQDIDTGDPIEGARVFVPISEGGHGWPYQASVSITSSGTTATVSHTAHGMLSNDYVWIQGVSEDYYNGVHQITKTGDDSYTYVMASSSTSPATGTPTSTFVVIWALTDVNGDASNSYSYTSDQPIAGRVRYYPSPYTVTYKTSPVTGAIDSEKGLDVTVNMVPD